MVTVSPQCVCVFIREYERSPWSTGPWSCCWVQAEARTRKEEAVRERLSPPHLPPPLHPPPPPQSIRYQQRRRPQSGARSLCSPGWPRGGTTAGTAGTCPADADRPDAHKHKISVPGHQRSYSRWGHLVWKFIFDPRKLLIHILTILCMSMTTEQTLSNYGMLFKA